MSNMTCKWSSGCVKNKNILPIAQKDLTITEPKNQDFKKSAPIINMYLYLKKMKLLKECTVSTKNRPKTTAQRHSQHMHYNEQYHLHYNVT